MSSRRPSSPAPPEKRIDLPSLFARLTLSEKLLLGGAVAFLIVSFLPWYAVSVAVLHLSSSNTVNAWSYWAGALGGVVALLVVLALGLRLAKVKLPIQGKILFPIAGAMLILCSILYLVLATRDHSFADRYVSSGPSVGFFLGILAGLVVIVGGALQPSAAR